jgi:hypothetical protein
MDTTGDVLVERAPPLTVALVTLRVACFQIDALGVTLWLLRDKRSSDALV